MRACIPACDIVQWRRADQPTGLVLWLLSPRSCNSQSSHIINSCTLDMGIIMSVSNLPNCLKPRFELRPSWNIYDTFPTGTTPDTTKLLGVRSGVKATGKCIYEEENKGVQHHPRGTHDSREPTPPFQGLKESQQQG